MNKLMMGAFGALMIAVSGCATAYRVTEETLPPAQPPAAPSAPAPLVIAVSAKPADKGAKRLASSLRGSVENRLAERGMTVASPLPANAAVRLEVSRRETARLDDWRTYEGTANIRVMTTGPDARLLSETTVQAAGSRALDEVKAEQGVLAGLSKQANAWLDGIVTANRIPVAPPALPATATCQFSRLRFAPVNSTADRREVLDAQIAFREAVSAVDGILSCRVAPDKTSGVGVSFDIAYDAAKFPDGLVNTLIARLRERGSLERFKLLFRSEGLDIVL